MKTISIIGKALILSVFLFCFGCGSTSSTNSSASGNKVANNAEHSNLASKQTPASEFSQEAFYNQIQADSSYILTVMSELQPRDQTIIDWESDLHNLKDYTQAWLPELKGKTLKVFLQDHGDMRVEGLSMTTIISQLKIQEALNNSKPKLLSIENLYADKVSKNAFLQQVKDSTYEISRGAEPVTDEELGNIFQHASASNAALMYAIRNKNCTAFGADWKGLHSINALMMDPNAPPNVQDAFFTVVQLRSYVIAARTSEFIQRQGSDKATIVIGAAHKDDLARIGKLFGVKMVFTNTLY